MRTIPYSLLAASSLTLSSFAMAANAPTASLSYTNVDAGVMTTELANSSLDGDGLLLRGSLAVHKSVFLFAQIADIGYDNDVDGFSWGLGAGGHIPITKQFDLVGKIGLLRQDVDYGNTSNTENGYLFAGTVRGFVVDKLEIEGGVKHVHFTDSGNDTSLTGEGRYFFTDRIAGGVLVQLGDSTSFGINARFVF